MGWEGTLRGFFAHMADLPTGFILCGGHSKILTDAGQELETGRRVHTRSNNPTPNLEGNDQMSQLRLVAAEAREADHLGPPAQLLASGYRTV